MTASKEVYITHSPGETEALGEALAPRLAQAPAIALYGGLGMGKTAFTRGLARGLGSDAPVSSPTYAIVNEYPGPRKICHFDLYRLEHAYELEDTGIFDVLGYEGACLLEWGEQFQDELTDEYLSVTLKRDENDSDVRTITLEAHGERAAELSDLIDKAVQDELA